MIPIFIGYDSKETITYSVFSHSIRARATEPVSIAPISLKGLGHIFSRSKGENGSTEFSFSRFLVPFLMKFKGWAMFADCDMLCLDDITKLWDMRDDRYAVMVCKHDFQPKAKTKFLGNPQTSYPKKCWSSLMLMNCERCYRLMPRYVNEASGTELHQFHWLPNDNLIGEIPLEWNWLVGHNEGGDPKILHFTEGGPYFKGSNPSRWDMLWWKELVSAMHVEDADDRIKQAAALIGKPGC